jgi:hypothetical protein
LAPVEEIKSVVAVSKSLGERATWKGRTHRALNPTEQGRTLVTALLATRQADTKALLKAG